MHQQIGSIHDVGIELGRPPIGRNPDVRREGALAPQVASEPLMKTTHQSGDCRGEEVKEMLAVRTARKGLGWAFPLRLAVVCTMALATIVATASGAAAFPMCGY